MIKKKHTYEYIKSQIDLLIVEENDWINNKNKCINKILDFINDKER